ncbi:Rieske 2Fe-2S domain-containing protein [Nonomuraea pusilla]|uniref:ubiquinol-cytochrome c reductase iron-sulfur subunit n=1 Tax=Nonomuraea pusilla TaxID=46177 RepID=UPI00332CAB5D
MTDPRRAVERRIAAAFGVSTLAAVLAGAGYVLGDEMLLGLGFALGFAGLAVGLAAWSRRLLPQGPYVEEREPMISPPLARQALESELGRDDRPFARSALPRRMLVLAVSALGIVALFPIRSLLFRVPSPRRALAETAWRDGTRAVGVDGRPVRAADVVPGGMLTVFPEGRLDAADSAAVLVRVDPARLALPADRMRWTVDGIVAYSKVCTHAGCPIGLYLQTAQRLACPCHQSVFDVLRGALPVGGPAARPLPQLPLGVDAEGVLVARGDFPEPTGPGYWRRT